jgi:predicted metal-dependent enzyme (double-stranded beta helix superfamily)
MIVSTAVRVDHLAIARRFATPTAWPIEPRFDAERRWYHRLASEQDCGAEVWLLTWLPGQGTDLHDHGGSAGAFVVVSGELTEHTVSGGERPRLVDEVRAASSGRRFGTHHVHQIINNGPLPAISVHVYGPALRTMTRYRLEDDQLLVAAVDRAGLQW